MAGGKLTPRQKMINMMYLVLTALLALNVSADILKSFELISGSLHSSADKLAEKNRNLGGDIKASVDKEVKTGNSKNASIPAQVDEVIKRTNDLIAYIDERIKDLGKKEIGDTDPETGGIKNKDNTEKNYRYWMIGTAEGARDTDNGGRGSGYARELKDKLREYVDWANKFYETNNKGQKALLGKGFPHIAIDPAEDPTIPANSNAKNKTWEYYIFHKPPVVANVAMLEKFKNDIRVVEAEVLGMLRSKLGEIEFKIDSLVAMDAPVSQVVAAGLPFETKLFVTASSKQAKPRFLAGGGSISVAPDGQSAILKIMASGAVIPKGKYEGEQAYSATIEVPNSSGEIKKLTINKKFKVRKPEIVITSDAVQILYLACANPVNIDVPALGDYYNPKIGINAGEVIPTPSNRKSFRIVPTDPRGARLSVSSLTNGQVVQVGTVDYKVIPPPKPTVVLYVNGAQWDGATPIARGSSIEVRCIPDANFFRAMDKDARYQIVGMVIKAGSPLSPPSPVGPAQTSGPYRGIYASVQVKVPGNIPVGNKIYFQIEKINRINYKNTPVEEKFTVRELTLSAIVK